MLEHSDKSAAADATGPGKSLWQWGQYPAWEPAAEKLLGGVELRRIIEEQAGSACYRSPEHGARCVAALGFGGDLSGLIQRLNFLTDEIRAFELGTWEELGFQRRFDNPVIAPFTLKQGETFPRAEYVASGHYGNVFKISTDSGQTYALKVFYRCSVEDHFSGPWGEAALGAYINAHRVCDMPRMCLANPKEGWIISEFVDRNYRSPDSDGPTSESLGLEVLDSHKDSSNLMVNSEGQAFRVDFGHLTKHSRKDDRPLLLLKEMEGFLVDGRCTKEEFLSFFEANPDERAQLCSVLGRVRREDRLSTLEEMLKYPEAAFFPIRDFMAAGLLPRSATLSLFKMLMKNPDPQVRAQAIFSLDGLPEDEANYLGEQWYSNPDFEAFKTFLEGEWQMPTMN